MSLTQTTLEALETRLQELATTAEPEQLAYLAKALESVAGKTTAFDLVQLTDEKLKELVDLTQDSLEKLAHAKSEASQALETQKTEAEATLTQEKEAILASLETDILQHLSLLDTRKNEHLASIQIAKTDLSEALAREMERFDAIYDLPEGSTLMQEIKKRTMIEDGALPFVFGILSRKTDYYGLGCFTTELGKWTQEGAHTMMRLLCGCHDYETEYISFFRPPQLCFLQGTNGVFMHKQLNTVYGHSTQQYQYPHACLGVVFVRNTTETDLTRTLSFGGSCGWSSGYEGMSLFLGNPGKEGLEWTNLYAYSMATANQSASVSVMIPAHTTIALLLYTSAYLVTTSNLYYALFSHWYLYNMRSTFLKDGLEIDIPKTLKAWQCPGYSDPYQLWTSQEQ